MSLWSLSVPDGAVEQPLGKDTEFVCLFAGIKARLWNVKKGKYRSHTVNTWIQHVARLGEIFKTHPKTGVEMWQRVHQIMMEQQTHDLGEDRKVSQWRVQQPDKWFPTVRWEGEDMILEADRSLFYQPTARKRQVLISLKIAKLFGFMKQDPTTKTWSIGPNLIPSYPKFEYTGHDITSAVTGLSPGDPRRGQFDAQSGLVSSARVRPGQSEGTLRGIVLCLGMALYSTQPHVRAIPEPGHGHGVRGCGATQYRQWCQSALVAQRATQSQWTRTSHRGTRASRVDSPQWKHTRDVRISMRHTQWTLD